MNERECIHGLPESVECQECWEMPHNVEARAGAEELTRLRARVRELEAAISHTLTSWDLGDPPDMGPLRRARESKP